MKTYVIQQNASRQALKPLPTKKLLKLEVKDFFHKIAFLTKAEKKIINYLLYMAHRFPCLFMTQSTIAKYVGVTREWINKCIAHMMKLGLLVSKRRRYYYGWRTNIYSVSPLFFKEQNIEELFPILSSLRDFRKKFTQLGKEDYLSVRSDHISQSIDDKKSQKIEKDDPPDNYQPSFQDILAFAMDPGRRLERANEKLLKQRSANTT